MHGSRGRKLSEYGEQLREKQRLKRYYGMQEGQFRLFFNRALKKRGVTGETLLQLLETRLDNVVYRLGFAPSRRAARQMVRHRHIRLNGRTVDIPSLQVKPGFKISVGGDDKRLEAVKESVQMAESLGLQPPAWILFDREQLTGEVLRLPSREEIAPFVNEQLIVELYSK